MAGSPRVVGVDIGGTKVAAAVVDPSGAIEHRLVAPTPTSGGTAVLQAVAALVAEVSAGFDVVALGVGAPGVVVDGSVTSATEILPGWAGTPVRAELERLTGLPVAVDNDVRVMARGELSYGAGRGADDVLFVSVGTGVGGALALDGRVVRGPHGFAGSLAHLLVPAVGAIPCGCGRTDHLEAVASGPAMAAAYCQPPLPLPEVVALMQGGDLAARTAIESAATLLGRAIAGLVAAVDVERVVVGGGVAQIGAPFLDPLVAALRAEALAVLGELPVLVAELGTDAPLVGAAALARDLVGANA